MNEIFNTYRDLFIEESEEYIKALGNNLLSLKKNYQDGKFINNIFRVTHILKYSTGAVGLIKLSALASKAEELIHLVRNGSIEISEPIINVFLKFHDLLKNYISILKENNEPHYKTEPLISELEGIISSIGEKTKKKNINPFSADKFDMIIPTEQELILIQKMSKTGISFYQINIIFEIHARIKWLRAELLINKARTIGHIIHISPEEEKFTNSFFDGKFSFLLLTYSSMDKIKQKLSIDLIKQIMIENRDDLQNGIEITQYALASNPHDDQALKYEAKIRKMKNSMIMDIFNLSFADATASLSQMTQRDLTILPGSDITLITGEEIVNRASNDIEYPYFGSLVKTKDGLIADILFVVPEKEGYGLFDLIMGNVEGTTKEYSDDISMAMGEINNILASSFINNVANLIEQEVHPETPKNSFDLLGALLEGAVLQEELMNKKILCAEMVIAEKGKSRFHTRLLVLTDRNEFIKLIEGSKHD